MQAKLRRERFDAVIFDVQAIRATGPELLEQAGRDFPTCLRFLRSSVADRTWLKQNPRHQVPLLPADCETTVLVASVKRALRLQSWMAQPAVKVLLAKMQKLPTVPHLYTQITQELQSSDPSIDKVANLIAQDPVMTAKMLQVVNSAFFGLPREIGDPAEAVMFLGAERTKSLVLLASVFSQFDASRCPGFFPDQLWQHCLQVGAYARAISSTESRDVRLAETSFTAGLLHDVGKLFLAANVPDLYSSVMQRQARQGLLRCGAEQEVLGTTHAELGACLLGTWGLALPILEAIAWHHDPLQSPDSQFSLLTAVHAANALAHQSHPSRDAGGVSELHPAYLERLALRDRTKHWREACGLPPHPGEVTREEKIQRRREAREN
jgi:HD-like signal output (HDOD) protein